MFAVQNGGWCAGMRGTTRYQKYGKATNCKNGKGGSWANDVYSIGGKSIILLDKAFCERNRVEPDSTYFQYLEMKCAICDI